MNKSPRKSKALALGLALFLPGAASFIAAARWGEKWPGKLDQIAFGLGGIAGAIGLLVLLFTVLTESQQRYLYPSAFLLVGLVNGANALRKEVDGFGLVMISLSIAMVVVSVYMLVQVLKGKQSS